MESNILDIKYARKAAKKMFYIMANKNNTEKATTAR